MHFLQNNKLSYCWNSINAHIPFSSTRSFMRKKAPYCSYCSALHIVCIQNTGSVNEWVLPSFSCLGSDALCREHTACGGYCQGMPSDYLLFSLLQASLHSFRLKVGVIALAKFCPAGFPPFSSTFSLSTQGDESWEQPSAQHKRLSSWLGLCLSCAQNSMFRAEGQWGMSKKGKRVGNTAGSHCLVSASFCL